jgi:V8-like Glu-specific endopeptidase
MDTRELSGVGASKGLGGKGKPDPHSLKRVTSKTVFLVFTCLMGCGSALAASYRTRVIYGKDERVEAAYYPNQKVKSLSRSVAGKVEKDLLVKEGSEYKLPSQTLQNVMGVCANERFSSQTSFVECSGFLVAPDLLLTAGHCVQTQTDCEQSKWVFDYVLGTKSVNEAKVFSCKEIVSQSVGYNNDYAVLRLDRPVLDREPLKLRKNGELDQKTKLIVVGHPSGLPLKISDNGTVRDVLSDHDFFVAEIDTFGGNSGSPVLNQETLEVEGILVRGDRDYSWNPEQSCAFVNICDAGNCRGEDVQKITKIKGIPL